jgi:hypothetical protein
MDDDLVSFGGNNWLNWPFPIDADHRACKLSVGICICPSNVEVVCDCSTLCD